MAILIHIFTLESKKFIDLYTKLLIGVVNLDVVINQNNKAMELEQTGESWIGQHAEGIVMWAATLICTAVAMYIVIFQ